MNDISVSVIVPVYNVEKYLSQCLDSLLAQTLSNIEIICVNDGSTDGSLNILKVYADMDSRIVVLDQKNSGQSASRNTGMTMAKGKYIGFVDSDDFVDEDMFRTLYAAAEMNDADVSICNNYLYFEDSGVTKIYRDTTLYRDFAKKRFLALEKPLIIQQVCVWDRIYKREFLHSHEITFFDKLIYEDHLFSIQASVLAGYIVVVDKPLYYYRKNAGNSITDNEISGDKHKFDFLTMGELVKVFLIEQSFYSAYQMPFLLYYFRFAAFHQNNIIKKKNAKLFFKRIASLFDKNDLLIVEKYGDPTSIKYAKQILKGRFPFFKARIRRLFRRDHMYIYMRLPKTKTVLRLRRSGFAMRGAILHEIYENRAYIENMTAQLNDCTKKIALLESKLSQTGKDN